MTTINTIKLHDFTKMVKDHDLTFMYSDDGGCYRRGSAQLDRIREYAAKHLSFDQAAAIWNEMVDDRLAVGYREDFYWKE